MTSTKDSLHPALKLRHTLRGHSGSVYRMALSPDGQTLASPSIDNTVRIWDLANGRLLRTLEHNETVWLVGWSPDGTTLASASDNELSLWNVTTGQQVQVLEEIKAKATCVAWSPDGKVLAFSSGDQTILVWDV